VNQIFCGMTDVEKLFDETGLASRQSRKDAILGMEAYQQLTPVFRRCGI